MEFVIPNSTFFHVSVFGAWLCEAIVSLGDPGMSVEVLKRQLQDTDSKFVVCFDGSRAKVFQALDELKLLNSIQVIVMELACPKVGQDLPISEPKFQFLKGDNK